VFISVSIDQYEMTLRSPHEMCFLVEIQELQLPEKYNEAERGMLHAGQVAYAKGGQWAAKHPGVPTII